MRRIAAAVFLCGAMRAAALATPPQTPAMTFQVVRETALSCEPDCPEWIAAQGEIRQGSAAAFKALLDKLDGRRRPVLIQSNGGSVEDALVIGRLIRARGLAAAVARTELSLYTPGDPQHPAPGRAASYPAYCISACTIVLAGGVERYVSPLARVGVHQTQQKSTQTIIYRRFLIHYRIVDGRKREVSREEVSESKNTVSSAKISPPAVNAELAAYFKEMGEDPAIVALMQTATPEQVHIMSADELKSTRLATVWFDQPSAMDIIDVDSGLAGASVEEGATGHALLEAKQSWPLPLTQDGLERGLTVDFTLRRGGGGVAATLTRAPASLRSGIAPDARGVRQLNGDDATTTYFYPTAAFCDLAGIGVIFVSGEPIPPPTQAPGQPDPRAPLLRVPLAAVDGLGKLVDELCPTKIARR